MEGTLTDLIVQFAGVAGGTAAGSALKDLNAISGVSGKS
jgi:hypothetical protein